MTHILVFDNDTAFASDLVATFSQFGLRVEVTADGAAGIASAEDSPPALALITVELPSMQGYKICKRFKKSANLGNVPVVMISGEPNAEDTFNNHRKLRMRADDYILKPVAPDQLYSRIQPLISKQMGPPPADFGDGDEPTMIHAVAIDGEMDAFAEEAFAQIEAAASNLPPRPTMATDQAYEMDPSSTQSIEIDTAELDDEEFEALAADVELEVFGEEDARTEALPAMADIGAGFATSGAPPTIAQPSIADNFLPPADADGSAGDSSDQVDGLETALNEAMARSASLEQAEARVRELESTLESLRAATDTGRSSAVPLSSREILDLREQINKKDRTLLQLQDEISSKQKEILDLRDRGLQQERLQSEIAEESEARGRALADAKGNIETLTSDAAGLRKRLDDMKGRMERAEQKLETTEREVEEERVTNKANLERVTADHEIAVAELEDARNQAEQTLKTAHQEETSTQQAAHRAAMEAAGAEHHSSLEQQAAEHGEAQRAAEQAAAEAAESARQAHASQLEEAAQNAASDKAAEVQRLSAEHEEEKANAANAARTALEVALANAEAEHTKSAEAQLAERDGAHEEAVQALQSQHGQELAILSRKMTEAETLAQSHGAELETTRADLQQATVSIGELNEKVAGLESKVQSVEAIRSQTQSDLKETGESLQVAEDKLERIGEAMAIGLAILQSEEASEE